MDTWWNHGSMKKKHTFPRMFLECPDHIRSESFDVEMCRYWVTVRFLCNENWIKVFHRVSPPPQQFQQRFIPGDETKISLYSRCSTKYQCKQIKLKQVTSAVAESHNVISHVNDDFWEEHEENGHLVPISSEHEDEHITAGNQQHPAAGWPEQTPRVGSRTRAPCQQTNLTFSDQWNWS